MCLACTTGANEQYIVVSVEKSEGIEFQYLFLVDVRLEVKIKIFNSFDEWKIRGLDIRLFPACLVMLPLDFHKLIQGFCK